MIVLDTNVISAFMRPEENPAVLTWISKQSAASIWTTSITVLEIRFGLLLLPEGKRKREYTANFEAFIAKSLEGRVLAFDLHAAEIAAQVSANRHRRGLNIESADTQIAGIVISNQATLATRNIKDFADLDIRLVDPWAALPPT